MSTFYKTTKAIVQAQKTIEVNLLAGAEIHEAIVEMAILALQERATVKTSFNGTLVEVDHEALIQPIYAQWASARPESR